MTTRIERPSKIEVNMTVTVLDHLWGVFALTGGVMSLLLHPGKAWSADRIGAVSTFQQIQTNRSPGLQSIKLQQFYKGVEVIGAETRKVTRANSLTELDSRVFGGALGLGNKFGVESVVDSTVRFDLDVRPTLSLENAFAKAKAEFGGRGFAVQPTLKILPRSDDASARLIYEAVSKKGPSDFGFTYFFDAHSGETLAYVSNVMEIAPIQVYSAINAPDSAVDQYGNPISFDFEMVQTVIDSVLQDPSDSASVNALNNANTVLNYYMNSHQRDSFDGKGATILNVVHVGRKFANAFWDPNAKFMGYGDGDGVLLGDMTKGLDVAGHEMTHGVVTHTANFLPFGESGALNEAFADIFGEMIENKEDWIMGADIVLNPTPEFSGIRNMESPGSMKAQIRDPITRKPVWKAYPAHKKELLAEVTPCNGGNDRCWIHINSTLFSHAFYKVLKKIGREPAEKVFYAALVHYLTRNARFQQARDGVVAACGALYGATSVECAGVVAAFSEVGYDARPTTRNWTPVLGMR